MDNIWETILYVAVQKFFNRPAKSLTLCLLEHSLFFLIFSVDELKKRIIPIAPKYELRAVYLFDSYARNEATDARDVDILIDRTVSKIRGMFDMGGLYEDLCAGIGKEVDVVTTHTLEQKSILERTS